MTFLEWLADELENLVDIREAEKALKGGKSISLEDLEIEVGFGEDATLSEILEK